MKPHLPHPSTPPVRFHRSLALVAAVAVSAPATRAEIASSFDLGDEGWTLSGDVESYQYGSGGTPISLATPIYYSANGAPGGYIEHNDAGTGANIYFIAPEAYRGDLSAYAGGSLDYSLRINSFVAASPSTFVPSFDVVIISPLATIMLPYQITLANSPINYAYTLTGQVTSAGWHSYSFALTAAQGWQFRLNNGDSFVPATDEQIGLVMGNVAVFAILGEYLNGTDYGNLDSVRLASAAEQAAAVPEPAGCALLGGLVTLGIAATRRRRRAMRQ